MSIPMSGKRSRADARAKPSRANDEAVSICAAHGLFTNPARAYLIAPILRRLDARIAELERQAELSEQYWQIETLVPAENAISGKSYWIQIGQDSRITDEAEATRQIEQARQRPGWPVRLVKITKEIVR